MIQIVKKIIIKEFSSRKEKNLIFFFQEFNSFIHANIT